ncbi:MAG: hypothetical protein HYV32_02110 [Candidatus Kerfeldbacteria bacterium]|nr:hypothetical protein [Candidatus Kerfeldbacteria bacterium]
MNPNTFLLCSSIAVILAILLQLKWANDGTLTPKNKWRASVKPHSVSRDYYEIQNIASAIFSAIFYTLPDRVTVYSNNNTQWVFVRRDAPPVPICMEWEDVLVHLDAYTVVSMRWDSSSIIFLRVKEEKLENAIRAAVDALHYYRRIIIRKPNDGWDDIDGAA